MDLKANIKAYGWNISKVATELGITQSALSQQINNGTISIRNLEKVASIMGISLSQLVSEDVSSVSKENEMVCPYCGKPFKLHITIDKE